jgi:hypothetical protein
MDQSALQRSYDRLGAVAYIQSHEDHANVAFDRSFCNSKGHGNFLIALSLD